MAEETVSISRWLAWAVFAIPFALCCAKRDSFDIRVLTPDGKPVAGALVSGGFDWDIFGDETNEAGVASIPTWARGWDATVTKNNFYTTRVEVTPGARYTFEPIPESLRFIGSVLGTAIHFGAETLVTMESHGQYRVFTYGDEGVTQIDSAQLPSPARHFLTHGDTLWYATHDSGLFVYSLQDIRHPEQLRHIAIAGYPGPFLVIDSFVVVGDPWEAGPLVVYKFGADSLATQIASVGSQLVNKIVLISHYVVTLGYALDLPVVFDISDINHPREVYHSAQSDFWFGALFKNYVILSGAVGSTDSDSTSYGLLDLSDPANPRDLGQLQTDSDIYEVLSDSLAVGGYHLGGTSVLRGSLTESMRSVALVSRWPPLPNGEACGGSRPPYFVLGGHLWKLVRPGQP